jgi:hypothetical protein
MSKDKVRREKRKPKKTQTPKASSPATTPSHPIIIKPAEK